MGVKVITHDDFNDVYTHDPAAAPGRMAAIVKAIRDEASFEDAYPAGKEDILAVHGRSHVASVVRQGLFNIAALAAGATVQAAIEGLSEPCFALVRPPGHHAHAEESWGFCYFNNIAIAIEHLKAEGLIGTAYILDFDMHYGDGTVSIFKDRGYVAVHNPQEDERRAYLDAVEKHLTTAEADVIGVSAGFDNHILDWGGLLTTEDYRTLGRMVHETSARIGAGCFAVLEGGYNQDVLGDNVLAFLKGLQGK